MSDNADTVVTFTHDDGRVIEIDHLGIASPEYRGEFAIYHADKQIGEFMLPWAIYRAENKAALPLPDDAELIAQAKLALADDPRVLTQREVADTFAVVTGTLIRDLDAPPPYDLTATPQNTALAAAITAADFTTNSDGRDFPFFEDEGDRGYFGYGHTDKPQFAATINDYELYLDGLLGGTTAPADLDQYTADDVQHSWAAITEPPTVDHDWWMHPVDHQADNTVPITWIAKTKRAS